MNTNQSAEEITIRRVLVVNRGEIAVRVVRACRDVGLVSVVVYAEGDVDALFVRLADEAFALGGRSAGESYLDVSRVLEVARRAGVDAVHPGYGFLSEDAGFARAVVEAGLVWVGPPAGAIEVLGDKVLARGLAARVGAPLVAGTAEPVSGVGEVEEFAGEFGLPVAIKAAFGGGGRGLKVAWSLGEIPELFDSAVREARAAFGRGECFVERYVDRPRHVEAQVVADVFGNVVVVGTRDCSLQRRHQKLVEEAPAPFLSGEQRGRIHEAARAICREAGYVGAGTVEFLVGGDGTVSFLEVNTRLQVEHPVSEETTGWDLVVEQFRVASGLRLSRLEDPVAVGHSVEFRINGEDPGRGFLPAPGTVTRFEVPQGPGVRVDSGVVAGSVVGGEFDSLLAKVIVTGADRRQALARARRALGELRVEGLATVVPFHRAVLEEAAFTGEEGLGVHTRWIETEWVNSVEPFEGAAAVEEPEGRQVVVVEVGGRRLEVSLPAGLAVASAAGPAAGGGVPPRARGSRSRARAVSGDVVTAPMQGTLIKLAVAEGDRVEVGDLIGVLEAMKMENPVTAHKAGSVSGLTVSPGDSLTQGTPLCTITD